MAKIIVVVEVPGRTASELVRDASAAEGLGDAYLPKGSDVVGLLWGGDLEDLTPTWIVDSIID